jgi:peptide/nickel transport system permease protein
VTKDKLTEPSTSHLFGTDHLGRDVFARVVHGASTSLTMAASAVLLAVVVGALIGTVAGVVGGIVDNFLMRVVDVLLALPSLLVSLVLISALGRGPLNVAIAVGLASIASFARITRSEVLSVMARPYVESSRVLGAGRLLTLWRHVLPNSLQPVTGLVAIELGKAVLAVAALSFLGFGASAEVPEWGGIVSEGRNYVATAWWISTFPSLVIASLVLATNHLGESIRQAGR